MTPIVKGKSHPAIRQKMSGFYFTKLQGGSCMKMIRVFEECAGEA
jgi:hypothetical protein